MSAPPAAPTAPAASVGPARPPEARAPMPAPLSGSRWGVSLLLSSRYMRSIEFRPNDLAFGHLGALASDFLSRTSIFALSQSRGRPMLVLERTSHANWNRKVV